jgi:Skp family chaperone for outer membrane proteins
LNAFLHLALNPIYASYYKLNYFMKKTIIAFLALGMLAANLSAQIKITTVSVQKCLDNYYLTADVNEKIKSSIEAVQNEAKTRQEKLREEYAPLEAKVQAIRENPGLSEAAKQEQMMELRPEIESFRAREAEFQQWVQESQEEAEASRVSRQKNLIEDVKRVVIAVGLRENSQLVLDTSDVIGNGVPPVLYSDPSIDITNKVINELNKDRPTE